MLVLLYWLTFAFVFGLAVGSFLNVCVARLPYEKSLLWPGSRCASCLQPIRWYDNLPVVSYLVLRGRCRTCGASFSIRYLLVELFTGLAFLGLFYLEMVANCLGLPMIARLHDFFPGGVEVEALPVFIHHAILLSFLIVTSLCDLADMEIPLSVTLSGTFVGLVLCAFFPWPYPSLLADVKPGAPLAAPLPPGVYSWPVWYPLPAWLPAGSPQLGLATGLAGALAGMVLLRGVRYLFGLGRGIEGLGVGDADLMMMAGAFVGWQVVVAAFFVSVLPALFFAIARLAIHGSQDLPFGPSLATGVMITVLCWPAIGEYLRMLFFSPEILLPIFVLGGLGLLFISFVLRLLRGTAPAATGTGS
jgi:leader peptidase (prepilin peptidase)/N-methyltransferase